MSIMNMPPLALSEAHSRPWRPTPLKPCYTDAQRLGQFRTGASDPVQPRPAGDPPARGKDQCAAGHLADQFQGGAVWGRRRRPRSCDRCSRTSKAVRYDPGDGAIDLPVKLKVHEFDFRAAGQMGDAVDRQLPLRHPDGAIDIKDAVHTDSEASRSVYNWVCGVCRSSAPTPDDLVPFEKYAAAARDLVRPSSAARALVQWRAQHRAHRPAGANDRRAIRHAQRRRRPDRRDGGCPARDQPQSRRLISRLRR